MNSLHNIIEAIALYAYEITYVGAISILIISLYKRKKIHANDIASLATTTGIFFTFFGIVLALGGLVNLEKQANIQEKIGALLDGIFVAFIPSIVGAAVAVSTHVATEFWRKPIEEHEQEIDIDAQILQELQKLNKNLVGDGEASLTTRLEKFQLKVTENQDALREAFQQFAEDVADNIIEALKKSMDDLNEKLGAQFGENFGRFADVIPKLLEWQENYRETIESTQQQLKEQSDHLKRLLESLGHADESFAGIAEHADKIAECANRIDQTTNTIASSLTQAAEGMTEMRENAERLQEASVSITATTEKLLDVLEQSAKSLKDVAEKTVILDSTAQQLNKHVETINSGLGSVNRLADTLQGKAESIEKNMTELTEQAISKLANNLRGISEALVRDYEAVHRAIQQIRKQSGEKP